MPCICYQLKGFSLRFSERRQWHWPTCPGRPDPGRDRVRQPADIAFKTTQCLEATDA